MNRRRCVQMLAGILALLFLTQFSAVAYAKESGTENIRLHKMNTSENSAFYVENMFPGDIQSKDYQIKVTHKHPITLYFGADIQPGAEHLAEVMSIKVELPGQDRILYDGRIKDIPDQIENALKAEEKEIDYRITLSLDTSVGNEYQYDSLKVDFSWWYEKEAEGGSSTAPGVSAPSIETSPSEEAAKPVKPEAPKSGDESKMLLYQGIVVTALAVLFTLLYIQKNSKRKKHE